jgi:tRNA(Leu) C34 or U34 (ribose-2'-O)-methylase TrmL
MRGYCGIGVFHIKTEANIGTLWRSAFSYGADFIFTIGRRYQRQSSDTPKAWRNVPLWHFADFDDFKQHIPYDCRPICIELCEKAHSLSTFVHPQRAIYILGAEDHGLPPSITALYPCVQVESPLPYSLNVATAGSIVLYDRWIKEK